MLIKSIAFISCLVVITSLSCTRSADPITGGVYYGTPKTGIWGKLELASDSSYHFSKRLDLRSQSDRGTWEWVSDDEIRLSSRSSLSMKPTAEVLEYEADSLSEPLLCFSIQNPSSFLTYSLENLSDDSVHDFDKNHSICISNRSLFQQQILMTVNMKVKGSVAFHGGFEIQTHPFIIPNVSNTRFELKIHRQDLALLDRDSVGLYKAVIFNDTAILKGNKLKFPKRGWRFKKAN